MSIRHTLPSLNLRNVPIYVYLYLSIYYSYKQYFRDLLFFTCLQKVQQ